MTKHKGTPVYTQYSVAFSPAANTFGHGKYDEVSISFEADGGGTYGEFKIAFYDFGNVRGSKAAQLCVFDDALACLSDFRVASLIEKWTEQMTKEDDSWDCDPLTPDVLIEWCEDFGIQPSQYHLDPWRF